MNIPKCYIVLESLSEEGYDYASDINHFLTKEAALKHVSFLIEIDSHKQYVANDEKTMWTSARFGYIHVKEITWMKSVKHGKLVPVYDEDAEQ